MDGAAAELHEAFDEYAEESMNFNLAGEGPLGDEVDDSKAEGERGLEDAFKTEAAMEVAARKTVCLICGLHPRGVSKNICAMGCEATTIRAAHRDGKSQGPA